MNCRFFINGNIYTMAGENHTVECVLTKGDTIAAAGDYNTLKNQVPKNCELIDLDGKTMIPAFNDSHMHLLYYARSLGEVDLTGAKSIEDIVQKTREFIETNKIPPGKWIVGRGWNEEKFAGRSKFDRRDLDRASKEHPIVLIRACYHVCVANTRALEAMGVTGSTSNPAGGVIGRDQEGNPNGYFAENALKIVYDSMPEYTTADIKHLILKGAHSVKNSGITSVQSDDLGVIDDYHKVLEAYSQLVAEDALPVRINLQLLLKNKARLQEFLSLKSEIPESKKFRLGPLKILLDGSLGGRTAALRAPYADGDNKGVLTYEEDELYEYMKIAHDAGMQIACHAIGDRAVQVFLDVVEKIQLENPRKEPRHRIIHCQITDEDLIHRMQRLGVYADIQPVFVSSDWKIVESRVGPELASTSYAWKTLLQKLGNLGCGSDAPVESFNPLWNVYAAVTRKDMEGNPPGGWNPKERLSVYDALRIYTEGSAFVSFEEKTKGKIKPGMFADFTVLDQDPFKVEPEDLKHIKVVKTFVGDSC